MPVKQITVSMALLAMLVAGGPVAPAVADIAGDPLMAQSWHLNGDGPMGIASAWERTTGGEVVVAVLDSGADLRHPDLAANLWTNPGEIPGNGVDDDADGYVDDVHGADVVNRDGDPSDDNGHGTHVAGIIGARRDNGIGSSGVAGRVRLMPVKVLDARAAGDAEDVAAGLRYAVAHGARIVNVSLAGPRPSRPLRDAVEAARRAGVLVVAAAGNDGRALDDAPSYPVSLPAANVLGVAAARRDGGLVAGSNYGAAAELAAPGEDILSTARGGWYELRSGTSVAAPMVTGAAALIASAAPALDYRGLVSALTMSAQTTSLPSGTRRLDAGAAVGLAASGAAAAAVARDAAGAPAGRVVLGRAARVRSGGSAKRLGRVLRAARLRPVEQRRIRRRDAVPHLFDRIDVEVERLRERGLGEPRGDADAQAAGRQLQQREPLILVHRIEHRGKRGGRFGTAESHQAVDDAPQR